MKKEFLLAILIASVCFMAHSQPTNINVSQGIYFDGEPYLVVNPTNPQNIIVAYMGVTLSPARVSIKTKSSFDGGLTWGNYNVLPHFSYTWGSADVSMAIKNDGTIYLSYIDFRTNPDSGGIYITHSSDGGISWATPTQVWNANTEDIGKDPIDRPWLAVDNSSTATNGTLYLTSKPAYWIPMPNRPYLKTSIDGGQTWTPYRYIDTVNYLVGPYIAQPMAALTTTADGALCIAYPSYETSQSVYGKFFLAKSYSRGATFSYHDLVVNPPTVTDTNFKVGYRLVANPNDANQLCFVAIGNQSNAPNVLAASSNDGGNNWSNLVRVNDDALGNGIGHDLVWASYDNNGKLLVTWRDRRNASGAGYFQSSDIYAAISSDNGATFSPNIRLSSTTVAFDSVLLQKGNDFMSCQLVHDSINAVWGDVRTGHLNIFFVKSKDTSGQGSNVIEVASETLPTFGIYPNPAKENFVMDKNDLGNEFDQMELTDALGNTLLTKLNVQQKEPINCSHLAQGTYFVTLSDHQNHHFTQRLLIEK